jgi:hypothetical protein
MNTTTQPNDGGPAFPVLRETDNLAMPLYMASSGMTLRDWFAGMALQGQAHRFAHPHEHRELLASDCYDIADAMIAARKTDIHPTVDQLRRGIQKIIAKPDFTNPEEMVRRLHDLLNTTNTTAQ